ncbi:M28 family peptidase [Pontixanthobacter aestiaquae]|uniref:M28 family peptidase n=1 Tax=Pontixanthobacter aestiaquae TaxID=1509367 RepID=A0A844Z7I2_9SPHN|nr:M28 family peptidase [Pontixanthobacter aestiaquae]MDN3645230.1 M28 family peptidase [Pontixanthobacter aestiaquae]MXO83768.1 M28 family peptidase [Pontixanthobacter aestiaquae]
MAGAAALFATVSCAPINGPRSTSADSLQAIEADMRAHIAVLASDEFEGRRPGTDGERKTLSYLAREWQEAGLQSATNDPANPWFAPVELALWAQDTSTARFIRDGNEVEVPADQVALFSSGRRTLIEDSPLLYVGKQGTTLEQSELAGRIAVMEWDHPQRNFQRDALLENGAAAVLAIMPDAVSFNEIRQIRANGAYRLADGPGAATLDGIVTADAATTLLGERYSALKEASARAGFRPVNLGVMATLEATSVEAVVQTHNLVAKLPGKVPDSGAVLIMAHWDHFGMCGKVEGEGEDRICNGAVDNASGLAFLTELAVRLSSGRALDRDVYFVATTAEEWGLLGARAFTRDPPLPLESIVAAFNVDTIGLAPRGEAVAILGEGLTLLDPEVNAIIMRMGRRVEARDFAAQFVTRQDGWALLQSDVPTLMVSSAFARPDLMRRYTKGRYHGPNDEIDEVELGGASQDLLLHLEFVRHFGSISAHPGS